MRHYILTVKHDNGTMKIKTFASSRQSARHIIMAAEGCPERAIINIK